MSKQKQTNLYIIRKYVLATSAQEAIRLEKNNPVDDVWIDEESKKAKHQQLPSAIGFSHEESND